jgi:hypothetical protein
MQARNTAVSANIEDLPARRPQTSHASLKAFDGAAVRFVQSRQMPSCCSDIGKANSAAKKARQASHVGASNHFLKSSG